MLSILSTSVSPKVAFASTAVLTCRNFFALPQVDVELRYHNFALRVEELPPTSANLTRAVYETLYSNPSAVSGYFLKHLSKAQTSSSFFSYLELQYGPIESFTKKSVEHDFRVSAQKAQEILKVIRAMREYPELADQALRNLETIRLVLNDLGLARAADFDRRWRGGFLFRPPTASLVSKLQKESSALIRQMSQDLLRAERPFDSEIESAWTSWFVAFTKDRTRPVSERATETNLSQRFIEITIVLKALLEAETANGQSYREALKRISTPEFLAEESRGLQRKQMQLLLVIEELEFLRYELEIFVSKPKSKPIESIDTHAIQLAESISPEFARSYREQLKIFEDLSATSSLVEEKEREIFFARSQVFISLSKQNAVEKLALLEVEKKAFSEGRGREWLRTNKKFGWFK